MIPDGRPVETIPEGRAAKHWLGPWRLIRMRDGRRRWRRRYLPTCCPPSIPHFEIGPEVIE